MYSLNKARVVFILTDCEVNSENIQAAVLMYRKTKICTESWVQYFSASI